jgi:hypothetical protein
VSCEDLPPICIESEVADSSTTSASCSSSVSFGVSSVDIRTGSKPIDCAAASLRRSRSSTSSSRRRAVISITSGRTIGKGRRCKDLRLRPNLRPKAPDAAKRRLPRFFGTADRLSADGPRE